MSKYVSQPAKAKKDAVKEFAKLIEQYPIIGIVDMQGLPTPQLQVIRTKLRASVLLKMTKTSLLKLAIKESKKPGIAELEKHLKGMPAILFTKENPFKLFKVIKQNKSRAPAKAGQTANADIVIPAGPTGFAPGPVIGELGALKIKTMVEGGKISIKEPALVAKEGDVITAPLASMLVRLNILPMEVGLNMVAVYDDGMIYTKQVLDVDEEQIMSSS
jgi:large subunit ribosomal protein L10